MYGRLKAMFHQQILFHELASHIVTLNRSGIQILHIYDVYCAPPPTLEN
jgi:hypothetical protein